MKKYIFTLLIFVFTFFNALKAQMADLRISNASIISGNILQFDVDIRASSGTIYLGNADFKFTFDATKFSAPSITRVSATSTLKNSANVNVAYSIASSVSNANTITININSPAPTDQTDFDDRVAKITNTFSRISTFRMQTFNGATEAAAMLQCQPIGTILYTIAPTDPFAESLVTSTCNIIIPIELVNFTGKEENALIQLNWLTATEKEVNHFAVEKSIGNDSKFTIIGEVKAIGNSATPQYYSLLDAQPSLLNYYRLKIIDNDGGYTYSKIITFQGKNNTNDKVVFYPNPATNVLNVVLHNNDYHKATVCLIDITGRIIATQNKSGHISDNRPFIFNTHNFQSGIYTVIVTIDGNKSMHKVVINK